MRQEREALVPAREEGRLEVRNNYKDNLVQYKDPLWLQWASVYLEKTRVFSAYQVTPQA